MATRCLAHTQSDIPCRDGENECCAYPARTSFRGVHTLSGRQPEVNDTFTWILPACQSSRSTPTALPR